MVPGTMRQLIVTAEGAPKVTDTPRWDFCDLQRHWGVVLTRDFVLLQTSRYTGFHDFAERLRQVLDALAEVAGQEAVMRIGLRYVDAVRASVPGQDPRDLVVPGLRGYPVEQLADVCGPPATLRQEAVVPTDAGVLAIRALRRADGGFLAPDLVDQDLAFDISIARDEPVVVLDFDHYVPMPQLLFDVDLLMESFGRLHEIMTAAFWCSVTDEALAHWAYVSAPAGT